MLNFSGPCFDYEPYPVCYIKNVLDQGLYHQLVASYPGKDLFKYMPNLGHKYSLSEVNNPGDYQAFLARTPDWKSFHDHVKSPDFVHGVLKMLAGNFVDLGLRRIKVVNGAGRRRASLLSRLRGQLELSARFEFSMMPANGGQILPHTDAPNKLITLVISMAEPGSWDSNWGGGTAVCVPKDRTKVFNHLNKAMPFDEVETLKTFPFEENQCVLFVKTYNSWHHVAPMTGPDDAPLRRTLTINIESRH
ncbi:2OG-Fe(II) oxygenase [Roseibium sp. M-1]